MLRFGVLFPHLNERQRRLVMAQEARLLGHGGVRAAGVSETTVSRCVRARSWGGSAARRRIEELDPGLIPALLALVEPDERGDPASPLRWTVKSLRNLAGELTRQGHPVSAPTVGRLLREPGMPSSANHGVGGTGGSCNLITARSARQTQHLRVRQVN